VCETKHRPAAWAALAVLVVLVATNGVFLFRLRTFGPLVGVLLYGALIWRWYRRDYVAGIAGGVTGLIIHIAESVVAGWTAEPLPLTLNLILPALLVLTSWLAGREKE
jgi:hypothetical protein